MNLCEVLCRAHAFSKDTSTSRVCSLVASLQVVHGRLPSGPGVSKPCGLQGAPRIGHPQIAPPILRAGARCTGGSKTEAPGKVQYLRMGTSAGFFGVKRGSRRMTPKSPSVRLSCLGTLRQFLAQRLGGSARTKLEEHGHESFWHLLLQAWHLISLEVFSPSVSHHRAISVNELFLLSSPSRTSVNVREHVPRLC